MHSFSYPHYGKPKKTVPQVAHENNGVPCGQRDDHLMDMSDLSEEEDQDNGQLDHRLATALLEPDLGCPVVPDQGPSSFGLRLHNFHLFDFDFD